MHDPLRFRRRLLLCIAGVLSGASLAACTSGSRTSSSVTSTTGTSSASGHGGSGGRAGMGASTGTGSMDGGILDAGSGGAPGTGGAGSGGVGGGDGGSSVPAATECFDWPPDGGFPMASDDAGPDAAPMLPFDAGPPTDDCPTNQDLVFSEIAVNTCPNGSGWDPYQMVAGPTRNAAKQCCYEVYLRLCVNGGRPYLIDDRASVSELVSNATGWAEGAAPSVGDLTPEARASLADAWAADALFEHASVASFSRVALELLALGAPADLVERTHQAALDEIAHAKLCFALASRYAGRTLAPGPFPLGPRVPVATSLPDFAARTVEEGCVGETLAAIMASEQLARATDPAVCAALERIAADEARHAELAWRTVAWAVRAGGEEVRAAVARALEEAVARLAPGGGTDEDAALGAHGRLGAAAVVKTTAVALVEVVRPSAAALLALRSEPTSVAA